MKFRFCGGGDCPDWVLAEIIDSLSPMDANKLGEMAEVVAQKILDQEFDEDAVKSAISSMADDSTKTILSSLHFLISNAARFNTSENVFNEEIQQLGLPKSHAEVITNVLSKYAERIREHFKEKSFSVNKLIGIECCASDEADELSMGTSAINCSTLNLQICPNSAIDFKTNYTFNIDNQHLRALLDELKLARRVMNDYNTS